MFYSSYNGASIQDTSPESFCQQLVTDGVLALNGETDVFTRDDLFASPSMAAIAVVGMTS